MVFYEAVQEFRVAEDADGRPIGCGALHVMWEDLGEVRTLAVVPEWLGTGCRPRAARAARSRRRELGLSRLFCLTFEVDVLRDARFRRHGRGAVDPNVYAELVRSPDEGVAEFLDLAR